MKAKVIDDKCIGCGQCESICPDVFKIDDRGISSIVGSITDNIKEDVEMASEACPTDAIEIESA